MRGKLSRREVLSMWLKGIGLGLISPALSSIPSRGRGGDRESGEIVARELYDHEVDPGENGELVERLSRALRAGWRAALPWEVGGCWRRF